MRAAKQVLVVYYSFGGKFRNVAFFVTSGNTVVATIAPSLQALAVRRVPVVLPDPAAVS
jgi:hypothetical protein